MLGEETTTRVYRRCEAGDDDAAARIVDRYAERLCAMAERMIDRRLRTRIEPEDLIQSVFRTFFRRSREGEFSIERRGDLWRLLATITQNRVIKRCVGARAQRRDVERELLSDPSALDRLGREEPSPEDIAELEDELERLLEELQPEASAIVRARLMGKGIEETAVAIGCSRWTVRRTLGRIEDHLRSRLLGTAE